MTVLSMARVAPERTVSRPVLPSLSDAEGQCEVDMATSREQYLEKLRDPRWQKKRLEILSRDNWKCRYCQNAEQTLHVHHTFYKDGFEPWDYHDNSLMTLCADCHERESEVLRSAWAELRMALCNSGLGHSSEVCGVAYIFPTHFIGCLGFEHYRELSPSESQAIVRAATDLVQIALVNPDRFAAICSQIDQAFKHA